MIVINKRQKELAQLSLDAEKEVLDKLEKEYKRALRDIDKKVLLFSAMIEQLETAIDGETDERQKEILISQRQSKVYQKKYQEALQGQINGILDKMHGDEYQTIEEYLKECYEDGYIGTLYDLQGQGIPLIMPIDQAAAVKAIMTDSKVSKGLYTALGVDIAKLKKMISSEITRGIATSRPYAEISRNLSNAASIPLKRAKTITRTEGHRVQSASNYNACVDAKAKGADVVKQWSAALDARTRPSHRSLDGQIVEVDEPFSLGNKTAMFPGDFGDPAEDCNCRCRVNQRARWALDDSELERLKERAKYFELDKAKDFEDYKQKYLKADAQMKQSQDKQAEIKKRREAYFARNKKIKETQLVLPDFNEMSSTELKKWIDKNLQTTFEGVSGANKAFIAETAKAVALFEHKMGGKTIEGLSVKFGGTPKGVYAKYDDTNKTILLKKAGSLQAFEESKEKNNTRYHLKWHTTKDYHATTTFRGTFFHELGHAVDVDTGQELSGHLSINPYLYEKSAQISAYAGSTQNVRVTPRSEAWAENFAAYMEDGTNKKLVPAEIVDMIEDYFKSKG